MSYCFFFFFFFNDTATTEIYTLSLHDALPISCWSTRRTACFLTFCPCLPPIFPRLSSQTVSSWWSPTHARSPSCPSPCARVAATARCASRSSQGNERLGSSHSNLPGELRPRHERPPGHHHAGGGHIRARRRRRRTRSPAQEGDVLRR